MTDGTESLVFGRGKDSLVYVFADQAAAHGAAKRILGDFRGPGEHWDELRQLLLAVQGGQDVPFELTTMSRTLTALPAALPAQLKSAAMEASARLRTERTRAFNRPVLLETALYEVRFEPIDAHSRILVPFTFREGRGPLLSAALELEIAADPIPIVFDEATAGAWAAALIGYAELTCTQTPDTPAEGRDRRPAHPSSREAAGRHRGSVPKRPGARSRITAPASGVLRPVGTTASYSASHVAGHRRQLRPGWHCRRRSRSSASPRNQSSRGRDLGAAPRARRTEGRRSALRLASCANARLDRPPR
jgi:hypothetical protein